MPTLLLPIIVMLATATPGDRVDTLTAGLRAEAPWLDADAVRENVDRALDVETDAAPAELLLALAWRESGYDPAARPGCGVLQVLRKYVGKTACANARRSVGDGYVLGAWALDLWVERCGAWRRSAGVTVIECALNAYAEGKAAGKRGWGVKGCKRRRKCDRAAGPLGRARRIAAGAPAPLDDV